MTYELGEGTGGLASAYQVMHTTAASVALPDTAGLLSIGVLTLPSWSELPPAPPDLVQGSKQVGYGSGLGSLGAEMAADPIMYQLAERGRMELEQGLGVRWEDIKRQLGDV